MKYNSNLEDEKNLAVRGKNKNKNLPSLKVILRTHTEVLFSYLIKGYFQTIHNRNKTTIIIKRQVMHVVEYVIPVGLGSYWARQRILHYLLMLQINLTRMGGQNGHQRGTAQANHESEMP